MRVQVAIPEAHVTKPILDTALEGVTRLNEQLIRSGAVPPFDQVKDQLEWKPEPPGAEHFDHAGIVLQRGWGDCDDLAPYKAASDRVSGKARHAKAVVRKSGPKRWHCIVERSDGVDPSVECGMPGPGKVLGVRGAAIPHMLAGSGVNGTFIATPQLALRPVPDREGQVESWQARADLPWHWHPGNSPTDVAMASLHESPVSSQAVVGAVRGAIRLGLCSGCVSGEDLERLECIEDACNGATWEELAAEYGPENATAAGQIVGSWFGNLTKHISRAIKHPGRTLKTAIKYTPAGLAYRALKPMASKLLPLASTAMQFVPGVGPVASMALRAATPALQQLMKSGKNHPPGSPQRQFVQKHMHLTSPPLYSMRDVQRAWARWQ